MRSSWLAVLVFVLGLAAGVGGMAFVCPEMHSTFGHHKPPEKRDFVKRDFVAQMQRRLDLTPSQLPQFSQIVDETMQRFDAFHKRIDPEFEQIQTEERNKVRAILTPDQRAKFEQWLIEFDRERHRHMPPPPHGG